MEPPRPVGDATPETDAHRWRYDTGLAASIEARWQAWWERHDTFATADPTDAEGSAERGAPLYVLDFFPYPSGDALHVGHPLGYIATDVYARFQRMCGRHVLHPFGFDAFGLPAEQYAVETGQHPAVTTARNIATMRAQLRALGLGHDPHRTVVTSDPGYYRWTQWIFLQLFNAWVDPDTRRARPIGELEAELASGRRDPVDDEVNPAGRSWEQLSEVDRRRVVDGRRLAYLAAAPVNWCPALGTVLANEEVTPDGRSERGNHPVYRRRLRQWMLRITAFADRLLEDLSLVDWPDRIAQMQRNWIGRRPGARIRFAVDGSDGSVEVFTTRPDTLFGVTFVALAVDHPMVDRLVTDRWPHATPARWRTRPSPIQAIAALRRERDDPDQDEEGTDEGVFTGAFVRHPATGERLPVFVARYVLADASTAAVMGVPAHDERDWRFARANGLPVRRVITPTAGHDQHTADPGEGTLEASSGGGLQLDGLHSTRAGEAVVAWLEATGRGGHGASYRLRDWLFSRQRYWGEPFPIVFDDHELPVALPADLLPVTLPELDDFRPRPVGVDEPPSPPLSRATDWVEVELDLGAGQRTYRRETNTMPQWAGSCWYYLRYLDPGNPDRFVDPDLERYWLAGIHPERAGGVDLYVGGVEHAVLHLLYARFWHKVLYDLGHVSTPEPFHRLVNNGYVQAPAYLDERGTYVPADEVELDADGTARHQGRPVSVRLGKMGKSLRNAVRPDHIIDAYGADTLRLYELAAGPLEADRPWNPRDIVGMHRFLQRLWRTLVDERDGTSLVTDDAATDHLRAELHATIDEVRRDLTELRFNTAIARLTTLNNTLAAVVRDRGACPREVAEPLVVMLAPFAPHIAEELWQRLGHPSSIADVAFPTADRRLADHDHVELPVQIDGRTRATVAVPTDADEDLAREAAFAEPRISDHLAEVTVQRVVYVPGRIINLVTDRS
jgi:leucyl-tRNA synthetase